MKQFSKELGKVSITPKGAWNSNITNERLDIVYDKRNNQAYIAKQNVPVGVDIDNREYWQPLNVSGYADNNFINLTAENENGTITAFESLEEAIATILPINRRAGATLSFYNLNSDRLDRQAEFELWQFNSTDLANWENKDYWNNIYYNWNVFVGWYIGVDALNNHVKLPTVGQYAYVGSNLNDAILYQCRTNGTWTNTGIKVRNYISVVVSGNVTIGENGNWFSDGKDTGIPATPAVDEQLDDIIMQLQQHTTEISNLKKSDANLQDQITSNNSDINNLTAKHESLSKTVQGIAATGRASTATNLTYNNTSGLNAENAQDAIDELQGSKIDKTSILQEFGDSKDKVMSQKAVTDKLSDLASFIKMSVPFTQGAYYTSNGELSTAEWAAHAEFDVSDKNGLYLIARLCAQRYVLYCGFKDSDGNIISTFGSIDYDNPLRMDSIVIEKIPDGAKTCYLSTQENSKIFKPCVLGYISNNAFMKELEQEKVPKVIIDTDFMTDVDDAIAIRLACNLESWGKINILGINISEKNEDSAIAMSAFLKDMGRGDIPISLNKNAASESSRYLSVCRDFPTDIYGNYGVEQSVNMYYRILSSLSQYDKCSIICIGHLTNVKEVMVKYPDLFARKVEKIYLMGGNFNGGNKEYNISGTTGTGSANSAVVADSKYVIENAKCKIVFSPFEYGAFIHTGSSLYNNGKTDDMLYKMLNAFSADVAQNGKQTWDGTTVLFAAQNNEITSYSTQFLRGIVTLSDTGVTTFKEDANGNHYIALFNNRKSVIRSIEKLIDSKLLFENFGSYLPNRLVKQVYTGAEKIELTIQHGVYYNKNGEQNNANWAISGIANIASYAGRYIYVECSCHSAYVYCGFKDSDGKVISTFQTDTSEEGERTIFRGSIPSNATSIFISSQYDYVPIIKCYAHF